MSSPAEIVEAFIAAFPEGDTKKLAAFFSEDAVYHNIPMDPVNGRDSIESFLSGFMGMVKELRFETLQMLVEGPIVMTERVDHFVMPDRTVSLPVMGVFEVHDGQITAWRDYFDLNQFTSQMG